MADSTPDAAPDARPNAPPDAASTLPDSPVDNTPDSPVDNTPDSSADTPPDRPVDNAPDSPVDTPPDRPVDNTPDNPADSAHGLDPAGLDALSISIAGGMPSPASKACPDPTTYAVEMASSQLSWRYCARVAGSTDSYAINQGARTLSAAEMRALDMVLANVLTTNIGKTCGYDKPSETLTLTYADHTATYLDDFYAGCSSGTSGKSFIHGLDTLIALLNGAARYAAVPTEFDLLSLYVQSMQSLDQSQRGDCQLYAQSQYSIDAAARQLSWSLCRPPTPGATPTTVSGSRDLSDAELGAIRAGLAALAPGASGDCGAARSDTWVALNIGLDYAQFSSDVAACSPDRYGSAPYVIGLDAFAEAVAKLAAPGS
jgi:hypothetical protein